MRTCRLTANGVSDECIRFWWRFNGSVCDQQRDATPKYRKNPPENYSFLPNGCESCCCRVSCTLRCAAGDTVISLRTKYSPTTSGHRNKSQRKIDNSLLLLSGARTFQNIRLYFWPRPAHPRHSRRLPHRSTISKLSWAKCSANDFHFVCALVSVFCFSWYSPNLWCFLRSHILLWHFRFWRLCAWTGDKIQWIILLLHVIWYVIDVVCLAQTHTHTRIAFFCRFSLGRVGFATGTGRSSNAVAAYNLQWQPTMGMDVARASYHMRMRSWQMFLFPRLFRLPFAPHTRQFTTHGSIRQFGIVCTVLFSNRIVVAAFFALSLWPPLACRWTL